MQSESSSGSVQTSRVRTTLCIKVAKVGFDPQSSELHASGPVIEENQYVRLGSYHTLDLELHRNFQLAKREWDSVAMQRIEDACDIAKTADVGAVVLQDGLANICLIKEHMTVVQQRIEVSIPRKGIGSGHEKGIQKFLTTVNEAVLRHFDFDKLRVIIFASPGFMADTLRDFVLAKATDSDNRTILRAKPKIVIIHSSSGHVHALNEVLKSPEVVSKLSNTKFARETIALDRFYKTLGEDETKAYYGPKHVQEVVAKGGVGTLLISDSLFRSQDVAERKKYVALVETVQASAGEVLVFSSLHESGRLLDQLTGIAFISNFPVVLDDSDDDDVGDELQ